MGDQECGRERGRSQKRGKKRVARTENLVTHDETHAATTSFPQYTPEPAGSTQPLRVF